MYGIDKKVLTRGIFFCRRPYLSMIPPLINNEEIKEVFDYVRN